MAGRRFFPIVTIVVAVAAIAAVCWIQYEANQRLREQADRTHNLLGRLNGLEVENIRLSNILAQANTSLSEVQLAELEKLRLEVKQLRARTNDIKTLQAEVRRLRGVLSSLSSNTPPDVPIEDIFPRDSWQFSGYDTPEDTLLTVTWAISQGDQDSYMAGLSPELRSEMQSQLADGSFGDVGPLELSGASGFRILDREAVGENQVVYRIYMDGENDSVDMVLEYIDGQWVVSGQGTGE